MWSLYFSAAVVNALASVASSATTLHSVPPRTPAAPPPPPSVAATFTVALDTPTSSTFATDLVTKCFGSSHAATALTADWQRQLTQVQADLGTEYVRFHGLLDDGM